MTIKFPLDDSTAAAEVRRLHRLVTTGEETIWATEEGEEVANTIHDLNHKVGEGYSGGFLEGAERMRKALLRKLQRELTPEGPRGESMVDVFSSLRDIDAHKLLFLAAIRGHGQKGAVAVTCPNCRGVTHLYEPGPCSTCLVELTSPRFPK